MRTDPRLTHQETYVCMQLNGKRKMYAIKAYCMCKIALSSKLLQKISGSNTKCYKVQFLLVQNSMNMPTKAYRFFFFNEALYGGLSTCKDFCKHSKYLQN
ncbi:UNVERIFIED_CONTAM: hypothetical protein K2H54_074833 [Gekko kuhli]